MNEFFELIKFATNVMFWIVVGVCGLRIVLAVGDRIHYYKGAYYRCTKNRYGYNNRKDGSRCEQETYETLRHMEKKGYRFLFGAYLPKPDGTTTEVDAIAIGPDGIVVIECKDYSGEVIGLEYDKYWSQERPYACQRNEKERWFYNPIMQNAGHIRALCKLIGTNTPVYSLIVFSDRCDLKVPTLWQKDVRVTQVKQAAKACESMTAMTDSNLVVDVDAIYTQLEQYTRVGKKIQKQHIKQCRAFTAR